ncbi:CBS domain-containing protein [Rhodohalobacter sulfatireducens]|uniref:CBS domain-containing protein n=1 Tax=Rhodohalobacter sulfatireducens TaxID=2911366 RepID=A0ABS9KEL7_9BACT|nr:CBS domain-containing protein [Rhodohalobacter sulfatireducens]MCG2589294.1 CBS domain-containing protein [Rhodohalobacter sulfatireducens]
MKVIDLLNKKGNEIYSIGSDDTVYDAIKKMSELGIGVLLVIDDEKLNGIISERDYRDKVILKGRHSKNTPVKDIMTSSVFCVNSNDDVKLCMKLMTEHKIRHLPVLDDNELSGIISIGDVVKSVIDQQKVEINSLRNYIAGGSYPG